MSELIFIGIVIATSVSLLLFGIRVVLKNSLATRISFVLVPVFGFMGFMGYVNATLGSAPIVVAPIAVIGVSLSSGAIVLLHRMVVKRLNTQLGGMSNAISRLSAVASQSSSSVSEQVASVSQVASTISEMKQSSEMTADSAQEVLSISSDAVKRSDEGLFKLSETISTMNALRQIQDTVQTVTEIAEQSNLLAVNAGIEAAKAAQYGRGFAVVASEVRNMAEQSKSATRQIRTSLEATEVGRQSVASLEKILKELAAVLDQASNRARQISGAALQQAAGVKQILEAIKNVEEVGKNTSLAVSEMQQISDGLTSHADSLKNFIRKE